VTDTGNIELVGISLGRGEASGRFQNDFDLQPSSGHFPMMAEAGALPEDFACKLMARAMKRPEYVIDQRTKESQKRCEGHEET
jgi:hypothetical protein